MITSAITKPAPYPRPSISQWGDQIHMSNLYTYHMQFTITLEDKFQYQWALIQYIQNTKVGNMQKKSYTMSLRDILDQEKQKLVSTSSFTRQAPLPWAFSYILWKQICMSNFQSSHRNISIMPKEKYWYQLMLSLLTWTNESTINDAKIETKIQMTVVQKKDDKKPTWKVNLWKQLISFDWLTIKTD